MGTILKILTIILNCFSVLEVIGLSFGLNELPISDLGLLPICFIDRMNIKITDEELSTARVLLMTSKHNYTAYPLQEMSLLVQDVNFNPLHNSMIYIHGFTQNATDHCAQLISSAFLHLENYNVLMVDLYPLFSMKFFQSVKAVSRVGETLGTQLHILNKLGCTLDRLILVGHSLGAHTAGHAGKQFQRLSGTKLPLIIGLDPAGPCYGAVPSEDRLDKGDATFVQAIHTNAGGFGLMKPVAHVDFYFNGGRVQPMSTATGSIALTIIISHERSVQLMYYATIYPEKFVGVECDTVEDVDLRNCKGNRTATFGVLADPRVQGIFYVKTCDLPPFFEAKTNKDLEAKTSNNDDNKGLKALLFKGKKFIENATKFLRPLKGIV